MYLTVEQMQNERKQMAEKWHYLISSLDENRCGVAAMLLENQERAHKMREVDITTGDVPTSVFPTKYAFPLIVSVFPNIVAQKLCQVQPMTGPVGKVFYKSYIHQSDDASFGTSLENSYARNTEGGTVKRGKLRFTSADVTAQKFILQAQWSTEVSEDMRALANLNVESDLMAALRDEVVREIDYLILKDLADGAGAGTATAPAQSDYSYQSHVEHWAELKNTIIDADVLVAKSRGQATDFVVGNATSVAKVRKVPGFKSELPAGMKVGAQRVGILDQWEIWQTESYPNANELLIGIKGEGYVYAPYIPLELMPAIYEPATDEWVRNVRTRAGRKLTIAKAFAKIDLSNIS